MKAGDYENLMVYLDDVAAKAMESPITKMLGNPGDYIQLLTSFMGQSAVQDKSIVADDPYYRFLLFEDEDLDYLPET